MTKSEGIGEIGTATEIPGARKPGGHRSPAKPQQGARRDVFGNARAARSALVGAGSGQSGDLRHVEVIQQADPHYARHLVQPAGQAQLMKGIGLYRKRDNQGDRDAGDDRATHGI